MTQTFWQNKRVFITGHTGFKGAWLAFWLKQLGAHVRGYALAPATKPSLFEALELSHSIDHIVGDIRNGEQINSSLQSWQPEIVFHLAAQAIVATSYQEPLQTYDTNVLGTLHVLEAIRKTPSVQVAVIVTSDKCYENFSWTWPYRENDRLGGEDIYSSSKACAEIATHSYFKSFFSQSIVRLATVRAGNVMGGGDFSEARIVPDIIRAALNKTPLVLRRPQAVRPWQHVLDPLNGYLTVAEHLWQLPAQSFFDSWNFGPTAEAEQPVLNLVKLAKDYFPNLQWSVETPPFAEAATLRLDSSKAHQTLAWKPRFDFTTALMRTLHWYKDFHRGESALTLAKQDLFEFSKPSTIKAAEPQR